MTDIIMPAGGMAMTEGLVVEWLKQPGDHVAEGEPVVEIETDKATVQIESPASGILGDHRYSVGDVVPVGEVLATVLEPGEAPRAPAPGPDSEPKDRGKGVEPKDEGSHAGQQPGRTAGRTPVPEDLTATRESHRLSPRARREAKATPREHLRDFREIISKKVSDSWRNAPHFAVTREIAAHRLLAYKAALKQQISVEITLTDLFLRALALSVPQSWSQDGIDIGLAVATPHGVVVPVIRDVLNQTWTDLAAERERARTKAHNQELSPADLSTIPPITLSNLGAYEVDVFTGIIPLGQQALLTVGAVKERVIADNGVAVVKPTLIATLNVDHRFLDGAEAARILGAFAANVTNGDLDAPKKTMT